jgi:anti-sigma factor RsiW
MRVIGGFGPTGDSDVPTGDSHDYATWDAAYVLGSLSPADRHEFEAHLSVCPICSQSVGELSGIPALLSKLDGDTVAAMDADGRTAAPEPTPNLLPSLMTEVRRRRRRTRMVTWTTGAAAAVLLAVGLFVGVSGQHPASSPPQATVAALPMDQVGTTALASTVSLSSRHWGTYIELTTTSWRWSS